MNVLMKLNRMYQCIGEWIAYRHMLGTFSGRVVKVFYIFTGFLFIVLSLMRGWWSLMQQ